MNKIPSPTEDLIEELKDPEFKKEYGAEQTKLEFAIILRDARTNAKLTQQQFAGLLGRTQPYIARLEGGEANPTLAAIGKMLAALDLRIVMQTKPTKPELETLPIVTSASAGIASDFMLVNTLGNVVFIGEVKSMGQRISKDWITIPGFATSATELGTTNLSASAVAFSVSGGA